jgi:transposase
MFDRNDETSPVRPRRVEVFTEPERRRDWPDETKIAIVAESLAPGVNISAVARRHGLNPQQLFGWRKRLRDEAAAMIERAQMGAEPALAFAPAVLDMAVPTTPNVPPPPSSPPDGTIEVSVGPAMVRIRGAADPKTLALVFKALRTLR